jgi:hypothetical protein
MAGEVLLPSERIADALERIASALETITSDDFQLPVRLDDVDGEAAATLANLLAAVFRDG